MIDAQKQTCAARTVPIGKYVDVFQGALDNYKIEHPHWKSDLFVSFLKRAFRVLHREIEQEHRPGVTWESPFTDTDYPVEWNWSAARNGARVDASLMVGKLTTENTSSEETATKTMAEMLVRHLELEVLWQLTNGVRYEKRGGDRTLFLPPELNDKVDRMPDRLKQREALKELTRPFAVGAALQEFRDDELREGVPAPPSVAAKMAATDSLIDISRMEVRTDVNGGECVFLVIFLIHPVVIDYDRTYAYYRMTVGLFPEPRCNGNEIAELDVSTWSSSDRQKFWEELFGALDDLPTKPFMRERYPYRRCC